MPDLFKQMLNEFWWKQEEAEKYNSHSMLLYLNEILKQKEVDSYESACHYAVEIFRYTIHFLFVSVFIVIHYLFIKELWYGTDVR